MTRICRFTAPSLRLLAIAGLLTTVSAVSSAADWPSFKAGNWSFERTMPGMDGKPMNISQTECADPTSDQASLRALLQKSGCTFTPLVQSGSTYRYSSSCTMGGTTSTSDSVLDVRGDDAFTITVETVVEGEKTREVMQARRIGDCP